MSCTVANTQSWIDNNCYFRYLQLAYPTGFVLTEQSLANVRDGLSQVFRDYSNRTNRFETDVDDFIFELVEVCNAIPGACDPLARQYCDGLVIDSTTRQRVCGCADGDVCAASCFAPYTIQTVDGPCTESRCIIDRVSIAAVNSNGSINIRQACSNCTEQNPCVCIFNADSNSTAVGNAVPLLQSACSSSTCTLNGQEVDCATLPVSTPTTRPLYILWILLAVLLVIGVICAIVSFVR